MIAHGFAGAADGLLCARVKVDSCWTFSPLLYVFIPSKGSGKQIQGSGTVWMFGVYFISIYSALLFRRNLGWDNSGWRTERSHSFRNMSPALRSVLNNPCGNLGGGAWFFEAFLLPVGHQGRRGTPVQPGTRALKKGLRTQRALSVTPCWRLSSPLLSFNDFLHLHTHAHAVAHPHTHDVTGTTDSHAFFVSITLIKQVNSKPFTCLIKQVYGLLCAFHLAAIFIFGRLNSVDIYMMDPGSDKRVGQVERNPYYIRGTVLSSMANMFTPPLMECPLPVCLCVCWSPD